MKGMANQEHLAKLKEGVEAWNEWREKNPDLQPDLQGANLYRAQLQGANLEEAQLQGADLEEAQLQGADLEAAQLQAAYLELAQLQAAYLGGAQLQAADLSGAQLQAAYLERAQLQGANLIDAQLQGANLIDAQLQAADLWGAQLQGANLSGAQLQGADLLGTFFDNATRLEKVILADKEHGGASLADVSWGGVNLAIVDWSPLKMLGDEYQARRPTDSNKVKKDKALRLEQYRIAVRANRQLAVVLRDQGLNEEADRFAYRAQVLQREVLWKQKKFGRGFFSGFLALVAGYGYRMERILFTYAIAVSLFAVAYFMLGMYYEPHLSFLDAVLTSVTAFHGRVFSEPFLRPGEPQLWVTAFEAVAGLVIEGVFIAMLTQRFFGR